MNLGLEYFLFGILFIWVLVVTVLHFRSSSSLQKISRGSRKSNVVEILTEVLDNQKSTEKKLDQVADQVLRLTESSDFYIQKVGLERFNPFNDTGGDQSFILALLDIHNTGVVISSLHTRTGTRWYAKKVVNGLGAEYELSQEEKKVIRSAKITHNEKQKK